ncbi:MAG: hypothetical protein C0613_02985 [Desulfobulbaceae bacterium]|nr:MAG: hypothetical protein C0613_02985 [Desulfobulbaceae bacterium]
MKTTTTYWNPMTQKGFEKWQEIAGSEGNLKEITLAIDEETGDYTRLTWFRDGYYTGAFGSKSHPYPEEIFVVSGRLYDEAFDIWLEPGSYQPVEKLLHLLMRRQNSAQNAHLPYVNCAFSPHFS